MMAVTQNQKIDCTIFSPCKEDKIIMLPADFVPGPNHVVCARGRGFWEHEGNKKYRTIIALATKTYESTTNKFEKTLIVSAIIESAREATPSGGFVKKVDETGRWAEVSEQFAREKVGQSLRDSLHGNYRSSTKAKNCRRRKLNESVSGKIDEVIHSNKRLSRRIEKLMKKIQQHGPLATDYTICSILSHANLDILETIKRDASLLTMFKNVTVDSSKV
jgi:hypothetical protein